MRCHPERSEGPVCGGRHADRATRPHRFLATLGMTLILACSQHVDRAHWQRMSPREKSLYVRSLIGAEKVKDAKGGNDRAYPLPPDDYIKRIDAAYARGDQRPPDVVFDAMGSVRR